MSRSRNSYSASFKLQVLSDYYANGSHLLATAKKWNIPDGSLWNWLNVTCKNEKNVVSLQSDLKTDDVMIEQQPTIEELQKQVSDLQKSLEYERLRVAAYERLIEVVKKEDGIDLLKKGGAKQ